jgi:alpha-tubulin suppressor-like RCC1 family protein
MIREAIDRNVRENFPDKSDLEMSTDDLIMAIVWVVLQAFLTEGLDDLLSHIRYISQFHFVSSPTSRLEFVLCHFQVALSWLYKLGGFSTHELVFSEGGYFSTDGDDGGDGKTLGMFESTVTQAEGRITSYLALQEEEAQAHAQAKRQGEEEEEEEEESLHSLAFSLAVLGCGRQGHTTTLEKLKRFLGGRKRGIRSADSAADFGVVVCGDGSVHCFGEPDCGRLGIELAAEFDRVSPVRSPRLVESMDALRCSSGDGVKEARCGAKHVLCLTESGGLYAWGDNRALQLGVSLSSSFAGTGIGRSIGRGIGTGKEEEEEGEMLDRPALLRAGGSLARAQELSLYGCCSPVRVHALHRVHVTAIACGSYHSLCLSGEGLVYSWGRSANGRLGHPPTPHGGHHTAPFAPIAKPALVHCPRWLGGGSENSDGEGQGRGRSRVVQISAGHAHSVALTDDGKPFTWGAGLHGRLGQGCHTDQPMPCSVSVFEKCRVHIAAASAGWAHTVFLSREGALFGTGLRAMGQLGPHVASAETEVDETGRSGAFEALWPLPLQALEGGGGGDGGGACEDGAMRGVPYSGHGAERHHLEMGPGRQRHSS